MSILTYLKPKDGLPNPNGPLSLSILSQAITLANSEVTKTTIQEISSNYGVGVLKMHVRIIILLNNTPTVQGII